MAQVVSTPSRDQLHAVLTDAGGTVSVTADGALDVADLDAARIGDVALAHGIAVHELTPQRASLEEAFMELTAADLEYTGTTS